MKDFNRWNELKKKIDARDDTPDNFPKEGEVWMSSVGLNIGYEQNGNEDNFSRPMLIVKKFNNHMFWAIPLSTKQKDFDFYFNYTDPNNQKVSTILAQMKLVSVKRLKRDIYVMPSKLFEQIKKKLKSFL
jgi:mRNA interferase MazF